jgi:electron transport complex protein RnfE
MADKTPAKHSAFKEFSKGIFRENPIFVVVLGLCPTLAVSTQTINGLAMGVSVIFVLLFSNIFVAMLRDFIPDTVRIPAYIVVIASFVTIVQLFIKAFAPDINKALGIYIPLIVVNCIILGRAEAFAGKQFEGEVKNFKNWLRHTWLAAMDGLGMGIGYTLGLTLIAVIRDFLGNGTIDLRFAGMGTLLNFGTPVAGNPMVVNVGGFMTHPAIVMILPPGGFLVMGLILALMKHSSNKKEEREKEAKKRAAEAAAKQKAAAAA